MQDLDYRISELNKKITNYYNPKRVLEIKWYSKNRLSFKLFLPKIKLLPHDNFTEFFKNKENSKKLGAVYKELVNNYGFIQVRGSYQKGLYNTDNWNVKYGDIIEYEYFLEK